MAPPKRNSTRRPAGSRSQRDLAWAALPDSELLDLRIDELGITIPGSLVEPRVQRLLAELEHRGFRFRPHFWFADEWFSPDGVPGVAVPFYLAHPRLVRLERRQMLEAEGGSESECMRILRHETGHALDTAYRLHRRRRWREVFGSYSQPYPETYQPRPYSRRYVLHLDLWYAQSHPAEDFAETFAVWLKPRSRWRTQYAGWPALRKLEYVDELMQQVRDRKPAVVSRRHVDPVRTLKKTLREHYEEKRSRYAVDTANVYDRELRRLFSDLPEHKRYPTASGFLRRIRPEARQVISRWTGQYRYTVDRVFEEIIERCRELDLRLDRSESEARRDALVMLTVQIMNHLHGGHHRLAL